MELDEIKKYQHKIKIINIYNKNQQSTYKFVVVKINLPSADDETIRFSLEPNNRFIDHQHVPDTNDYYCDIPNYLNQTITLYAHFFPNDLYEYVDELDTLVTVYDFQDIFTEADISDERYDATIDDHGNLIIQSLDEKSINGVHDPNYKEYVTTTVQNQTEQGFFPLSSKYRTKKNWEVPNLNDSKPYWKETNTDIFWEARIRTDFAQSPMKVFINYEYLPTSREYHQHYFGFEGETQDNNTINVFEGTNINVIDDKFGSKNNYRLINLGDVYNDNNSIYVPHENIIPINLNDFSPNFLNNQKTCEWKKSKCQDYYIYKPLSFSSNKDGYCLKQISLTPGKYYTLRYYIYIPSYAHVENDKCYIAIETADATYKIDDVFISKDKEMRNKWIYHEVPFLATEKNNIKIIGPQSFNSLTDKNNNIFFTNISVYEMVEYSPTLQYTNTSLRISEENEKTLRMISEPNTIHARNPNDKLWTPTDNVLPTPYNDVYISTDDEEEVFYDEFSTDLTYIYPFNNTDPAITYNKETTDITLTNNDNITWTYDTDNTENERVENIYVSYDHRINGVYGPSNNFIFQFKDIDGNPITVGEVEAGIFLTKDSVSKMSESEKKLSYNPKKVQGEVTFSNINLTNFPLNNSSPNNKYYIRLDYTHPCLEDKKIIFKSLYLYKEEIIIDDIRISNAINLDNTYISDININSAGNLLVTEIKRLEINNTNIVTALNLPTTGSNIAKLRATQQITEKSTDTISKSITSLIIDNGNLIYDENTNDSYTYTTYNTIMQNGYTVTNINQFPLKIEAHIVDQENSPKTTGYCELSIDDELNQTTIIDQNGWCDFYLDFSDLKIGCQTIKIEYYREYYRSLSFIYFNICLDSSVNKKDYVPIDVKVLQKGVIQSLTNSQYTINQDDCLLSSIDVHNHSKFRVEVYKDNVLLLKRNIYNKNAEDIVFFSHEYGDTSQHSFTIKTGNMLDENGAIIEDLYRDYQKTFIIKKKAT